MIGIVIAIASAILIAIMAFLPPVQRCFLGLKQQTRVVGVIVFLVLFGAGALAYHQYRGEVDPTFADDAKVWNRSQLPLKVRLPEDPEMVQYYPGIRASMAVWNGLKCKVFQEAGPGEEYQVRFVFKQNPCHSDVIQWVEDKGMVVYQCKDGTMAVDIQEIDKTSEAALKFNHELGHVLGLMHDDHGIMADPVIVDNKPVFINPEDARALNKRYCP